MIWTLWMLDGSTWKLAGDCLAWDVAKSKADALWRQNIRAIICREGADPALIAAQNDSRFPWGSP